MRIPVILLLCFTLAGCGTMAKRSEMAALKKPLNSIEFSSALDPYHTYLGLDQSVSSFTLSDLHADTVVIIIFSMYCLTCQDEAPNVNALHEEVLNAGAGNSIKFIGLGFGNSELESSIFKDQYALRFPVFADPNKSIANAINVQRIPSFIVAQRNEKGTFEIIHKEEGRFYLLKDLIEKRIR
ncbi:MAG: redoxin domain-containing protein [Candidatus Auribacterota bacterium]